MLVAILCAVVVFGCAQIREVTYPRDFVYLEKKERRSKMALLGFYVRQLEEILADGSIGDSDRQQSILSLLNKIDDLTLELGAGATTNHLVIDDHIEDFKSDVHAAIYDVRANPPNYYAVGKLIGSCVGCHKYRD